jgi:hypothetical protein
MPWPVMADRAARYLRQYVCRRFMILDLVFKTR